MDKENLRKRFKIARGALDKKYIYLKSLIISLKVSIFLKKYRFIATYYPFNKEVNPNLKLIDKILLFPKIKGKDMDMCLPRQGFIRKQMGVMEPFGACCKVFKKEIEAIIVPALVFDLKGYRIGYGGGFYDRFLKDFDGLKIGVAYDCCIVDKIEHQIHDIAVDYVITEKRNIICKLRR